MKKNLKKLLALLLSLALLVGFIPLSASAGGTETVEILKVVYTDNGNGTASAAITFTYTGKKITYIDPMIGRTEGSYDFDLDTQDALNLPQGWALKKNEDGSYTLIANPLRFTMSHGEMPPAGSEAWVGVDVSTMDGGNYTSGSDQLKITVPGKGQTVEVVRGGGGSSGTTDTKIAVPTGKTLTYNTKEQYGVEGGAGYSLTGELYATNVGTYAVVATPKSGYVWTDGTKTAKSITWKIVPNTIARVSTGDPKFTYNGKVQKPSDPSLIVVTADGLHVSADNYTLTYANAGSKNVGTYTLTVTGKANCTGSASTTYTIEPAKLTKMTLQKWRFDYDGQVHKPTETDFVVQAEGGLSPLLNTDYTLTYANPNSRDAGEYAVTATGKGNYTGSVSEEYLIATAQITGVTLSATSFLADGTVQKPTVQSVSTVDGVALTPADYDVVYSNPNSSAVGVYTVTVNGKRNGGGSASATYKITNEKELESAKVVGMKENDTPENPTQLYTKEEAWCIGLEYGGKAMVPGAADDKSKDYVKTVTEATREDQSKWWIVTAEHIEGKSVGRRTIEVKQAPKAYHNVTVRYVMEGTGETAAPTVVKSFQEGTSYAIPSPKVEMFRTADAVSYYYCHKNLVVGTMGTADVEYVVIYGNPPAMLASFSVDVVYTVEDAQAPAPDPVHLYLETGKSYSVTSPALEGYKPTIQVVQGTVTNENIIVDVTYKKAYTLTVVYKMDWDEDFEIEKDFTYYAGETYDVDPRINELEEAEYESGHPMLSGGAASAFVRDTVETYRNSLKPSPERVQGVMPSANKSVTVVFTCTHAPYCDNLGDGTHQTICTICNAELTEVEAHTWDAGRYVEWKDLPSGYQYKNKGYYDEELINAQGLTCYQCTQCSAFKMEDPSQERCPASPKDENYTHLWSRWEKISDTQCQRTCFRCKAVETSGHMWGEWRYCSTASHYRMCQLCKCTETASHGAWLHVSVTTPATCISNAEVTATCGICRKENIHVYHGLVPTINKDYAAQGHDFTGGMVSLHGGHTQKCTRCGAFDMEHHEQHSWGDWYAISGTGQCGVETTYRRDCTRCSAYETKRETRQHIMVDDPANSTQVSCDSPGVKAQKCIQPGCTHTTSEQVNALGHAWEEDDGNYEATCEQAGRMSYHCSRAGCSATKGGEVPAKSPSGHHEYGPDTKKNTATCTLPGDIITSHVCKYCGKEETVSEESTGKLGHSLKESSQKINWRERVVSQAGKRPAVVYEEVFYVTRECTRCGYNAPNHIYTVSRSENLNKYAIVTGDVKVNLVEDGIRVNGQFGKDGGAYFNQTVNTAYQNRLELDRSVYEQHEGSVVTKFKQSYLNTLEDGDYYFILTNGDELAAARVTVAGHALTAVEDGVFDGHLDETIAAINAGAATDEEAAQAFQAYLATEESAHSMMTDGEYLFYLGAAAHVMTGEADQPALNGTADPEVAPYAVSFDQNPEGEDYRDVVVLKYDKGHTFDEAHPLTLFGEEVPVTETVYVYDAEYEAQHPGELKPDGERTNYTIVNDKITLSAGYLASLGQGEKDFLIHYTDGEPALLQVTITTTAEPEQPGPGPAPGPEEPEEGALVIEETEHGTVTADPEEPAPGDTVTLTLTPDKGYTRDDLTVVDGEGKPVLLTRGAKGTFTFEMPQTGATVTAGFREKIFTDVGDADWFHDAVYYVYDKGYFVGVSDTAFGPGQTMSRAMFATVLYRMAGQPKATGKNPFTDVPEGKYYTDAVIWAASNGIIAGYGNGRFGPKNPVTREQMVSLFWRLRGKPVLDGVDLTRFADAEAISDWARDAMEWAVGVGLISGKGKGVLDPTGILDPKGKASRAEVAQVVKLYSTLAR